MDYKVKIEHNKKDNAIQIYTDGANRNTGNDKGSHVKPTDKAAYGYYMEYQGLEKEEVFTGYGYTNNYCELMAFYSALKALKRFDLPVRIYSDSAYVVNSINKEWYKGWRAKGWTKKGGLVNSENWKETIELFEKFNFISVIKVKGHSNNENNNHVDEILNEAMDNMEERG